MGADRQLLLLGAGAQEEQFYEEILLARHQEDLRDRASLDNIELRFRHAMSELDKLDVLSAKRQPDLIWRMGLIHSVSVRDDFYMYCARALLNHDWPLRRFRDTYYLQSRRFNKAERQEAAEMELSLFRPVARLVVSRMTFQNPETSENILLPFFISRATGRCIG